MINSPTFKAIIKEKCPRCHKGDLFVSSPYKLSRFTKMNKQCDQCAQTFDPEPGFYFGAMYIAYALLVALSVTSWVALYVLFDPGFTAYVVVIVSLNILLLPLIFRYSRTIFLFGFGMIKK